ncbi:hypothetical protein MCEMIEM13_02739 [Comamonadaceae bacterium]
MASHHIARQKQGCHHGDKALWADTHAPNPLSGTNAWHAFCLTLVTCREVGGELGYYFSAYLSMVNPDESECS